MEVRDEQLVTSPAIGADTDSAEITLLRTQISELVDKAKNFRVRWLIVIALVFLGFLAPLGMGYAYDLAVNIHPNPQQFALNKKMAALAVLAQGEERIKREKEVQALFDAKEKETSENKLRSEETFYALTLASFFCAPWVFPIGYIIWVALSKKMMERTRYRLEYKIIEAKARELQEKIGEDFFTRLVQINFKYLDQYYFQTHQQANKSFALSAAASIVGLLIIVVAIFMVMFENEEPAYLTAAMGGLSQFIAAVFFYLYNRTIVKMGEYHKKLVLTQNIGIALKITDMLPAADKVQTQRTLIGQLTMNINQHLSEIETAVVPAVPVLVPVL